MLSTAQYVNRTFKNFAETQSVSLSSCWWILVILLHMISYFHPIEWPLGASNAHKFDSRFESGLVQDRECYSRDQVTVEMDIYSSLSQEGGMSLWSIV